MGDAFNGQWNRTLRSAATLVVATMCTLIPQQGAASGETPIEGPGPAFGAKILDIALTLDAQAMRSLTVSPANRRSRAAELQGREWRREDIRRDDPHQRSEGLEATNP